MNIGVYPGSFDPVTNGHLDIIRRSAKIVDKLIVGVLQNPAKNPLFTVAERINQLNMICGDLENVEVEAFSGLLIDFVNKKGAKAIIRGLRAVTDFEYEFQMALMNRNLSPEVDTIFLATSPQYSFLSSSIVKEVARYGGNIEELVPMEIVPHLIQKFR